MKKRSFRGPKKSKTPHRMEKRSSNGGWKKVVASGRREMAPGRFGKTRIRAARTPVSAVFAKKSTAAKLVQSLQDKKTRAERKLFLVEGEITTIEALEASFVPHSLFVTHEFLENYPEILEHFKDKTHIVDENELASMGTMVTNRSVIGVFHQKDLAPFFMQNEIVLALDNVNDPGNLGTIVRIADWYGIRKIVASRETVDIYNPKTISATKGSFARVDVYYQDLEKFFTHNKNVPVFAADLQGDDVHTTEFPPTGILLLGNEAHGINPELSRFIQNRITIPRFGGAESLNVAIAGAVILDNWLR